MTILELSCLTIAALGAGFGLYGIRLSRQWVRACKQCHIIIAIKGRVALNANLIEWLAWDKAMPAREGGKGGVIFRHSNVSVALARPKYGPAATSQKTRVVDDAAADTRNRRARRAAVKSARSSSTSPETAPAIEKQPAA